MSAGGPASTTGLTGKSRSVRPCGPPRRRPACPAAAVRLRHGGARRQTLRHHRYRVTWGHAPCWPVPRRLLDNPVETLGGALYVVIAGYRHRNGKKRNGDENPDYLNRGVGPTVENILQVRYVKERVYD